MSLIREQRMDKNGKLNTKLVRADGKPASAKKMPAPSVAAPAKPKAMDAQKRWRMSPELWECDDELRHLCSVVCTPQSTYTCSDAEAYDILRVVDPKSLHPLLAIGMRNSQDVLTFLSETGVSRLARDNKSIIDEAVSRNLPTQRFCEFWVENQYSGANSAFMDAAETHVLFSSISHMTDAPQRVLNKLVDLEDIKTVGVQKVIRAESLGSSNGTGSVALNQLQKIKQGDSAYDAKTMKRLMDHASKQGSLNADVLLLANRYGVDTVLSLQHVSHAWSLNFNVTSRGYTREDAIDVLTLSDRIRSEGGPDFSPTDTFTLYEAFRDAGYDVDKTLYGIRNGLNPEQLRAVLGGEVEKVLADGWL